MEGVEVLSGSAVWSSLAFCDANLGVDASEMVVL